jgi:hypothetical protein
VHFTGCLPARRMDEAFASLPVMGGAEAG